MGGAIALGAIASGKVKDKDMVISYPLDYLVERFDSLGYMGNFTSDNELAVAGADVVVIAVKPWMMEQVLRDIKDVVTSGQVIVSVAAGVTFDQIEAGLRSEGQKLPPMFRVIPNTAIALGESATFISHRGASEAQTEKIVSLFATMGRVFLVEESQMAAVTALSSCGIAYAFRYIDAAVKGGVEMGLGRGESLDIVIQTVKGALKMLETNHSEPQAEIDKVTTPGGLTLKGLEAMEKAGFSKAVISGIKASK